MKPAQKIKRHILLKAIQDGAISINEEITQENVCDLYESNNEYYRLQDYESEIREGEVESNIAAPNSGHYETKSVAAQMSDGSWVGWTYWYGGGKHGEPEAIDWIDDAYDLNCKEEEKLVIVRTFEKA